MDISIVLTWYFFTLWPTSNHMDNDWPSAQWQLLFSSPFIHSANRECEQQQFATKEEERMENAAANAEANVSMFNANWIELDKMKIGMCFDLFGNMSGQSVFFLLYVFVYLCISICIYLTSVSSLIPEHDAPCFVKYQTKHLKWFSHSTYNLLFCFFLFSLLMSSSFIHRFPFRWRGWYGAC